MFFFVVVIFNFLVTWFITKLIINPFKKKLPDIPNKRSAHNLIKPRGGGISFISSNLISASIFGHNSFAILLPLSLIGLLDDIFNINKWYRLIIQLITSYFLLFSSDYFDLINKINIPILKIIAILITILVLTGLINFCNFMDGIDGVLTGSMLIVLLSSTLIIFGSTFGLIGSLFGFLIWNWKPSKIFMGDIGSNFLGGILVWILLNASSIEHSVSLLLIATPIIFDPLICILRRLINKQDIFNAHSLHLYQRLSKNKIDHDKVSILYIISSLFISISYFIGGLKISIISFLMILIFGFWLDKKYAVAFKNSY